MEAIIFYKDMSAIIRSILNQAPDINFLWENHAIEIT